MNIAIHQDKEKYEKTGKRKAGKERRQETDFKEAGCCPCVIVQGTARGKNGLCGGVSGVTGTLRKANSHFNPTKRGWERHHHVKAAIDWSSSILLALNTVYMTEISHFTIQKD